MVFVGAVLMRGVGTDFDDEDFDVCFDVWDFLVLYGLAGGAFFTVVSVACDAGPAPMARSRSRLERRRSNIYCTPLGWVEVAEMTGVGSFGWGPG